jgi:hypothetical protein
MILDASRHSLRSQFSFDISVRSPGSADAAFLADGHERPMASSPVPAD